MVANSRASPCVTANVHVSDCCDVCKDVYSGMDDFVWPERNLFLNSFNCFTHFEINWNGELRITKTGAEELGGGLGGGGGGGGGGVR